MEVRSVEAIVRALNDAQIRYLIVGGLAVIAHGYERLTRDIDLVISLESQNIVKGLRALETAGYKAVIPVTPEEFADSDRRETWRREKNMIVLRLWSDIHPRTPIDVFVYEPFDFADEYANARWEAVTENLRAPIVRYDTLLKMKAESGRDRDLLDIRALRKLDPHR